MIPWSRSECTIEAKFMENESTLSQDPPKRAFVPRLMLITFTPSSGWSKIQSRPEMIWSVPENDPSSASTLTITSFDAGATPIGATPPFPLTIPATFVPWPLSSRPAPGPLC